MTDPNELTPMPPVELPVSYGYGELTQHNIEASAQHTYATVPERLWRGVFNVAITGLEAVADAPYPRAEDAEASLVAEGITTTQPSPALIADRAFVMRRTWWRQVRTELARPLHKVHDRLRPQQPSVHEGVWFDSGNGEQLVEFEQPKVKAGWLVRLVERIPSPIGPEARG